jgi:thiol-disulfide isomerase/thioredoxin
VAYAVGLVVVGLLGMFNLVLSFGLVRRLREHSGLLARVTAGPGSAGLVAEVGTRVAPFRVTAVDGALVDRDVLAGPTLVGFFAPGCGPCGELLPRFVAAARAMPGGRAAVVAVVVEDGSPAGYLVDPLAEVASVVLEERGGVLGTAFGVDSYPVTCVVDAVGVVTSTRLPSPVGV